MEKEVHSLDFGYTECTAEISKKNVQQYGLRENVWEGEITLEIKKSYGILKKFEKKIHKVTM